MVLAQILGPLPLPQATCKLTYVATVSIANNTTTDLSWTTETWLNGLTHAANDAKIVVITPGKYQVVADLVYASNATGIRYGLITHYNAANAVIGQAGVVQAAANGDWSGLSCTGVFNAVAGDYFKVQAVQTSGGALNMSFGTNGFYSSVAVNILPGQ